MIRARAALTRQVQEQLFHRHLVGIFQWDDVKFDVAEKTERPEPEINARGRRRRPEGREGKYRARIALEFGIWKLTVEAPSERPPLGWIELEAGEVFDGPLDPATWERLAVAIKQKHEELRNGA